MDVTILLTWLVATVPAALCLGWFLGGRMQLERTRLTVEMVVSEIDRAVELGAPIPWPAARWVLLHQVAEFPASPVEVPR